MISGNSPLRRLRLDVQLHKQLPPKVGRLAVVSAAEAPHGIVEIRLVPDLPVLDAPPLAVGPAPVVVAHRASEHLHHLVDVGRNLRVEMHDAGMLDRRSKAVEDVQPDVAGKPQHVVCRLEVVVRRIRRVEVHQREDEMRIDDALTGIDQRKVVGAHGMEVQLPDLPRRLVARLDLRRIARRVQFPAHRPLLDGEVGGQRRRRFCKRRRRADGGGERQHDFHSIVHDIHRMIIFMPSEARNTTFEKRQG